jgi:hypothetical protein
MPALVHVLISTPSLALYASSLQRSTHLPDLLAAPSRHFSFAFYIF